MLLNIGQQFFLHCMLYVLAQIPEVQYKTIWLFTEGTGKNCKGKINTGIKHNIYFKITISNRRVGPSYDFFFKDLATNWLGLKTEASFEN